MSGGDGTPKALVVEHSEHVLFLLDFMLSREGYDVTGCADGREADTFIRNNDPVDIVILDLVLPYKDGYELLRLMRDDPDTPEWADVPVIVLTARKMESDIVRGLDSGANDYVTKPYSPGELMARIRRHVSIYQDRRVAS
ncbi:MAG: response regulator [Gammaproteobacteria bacterium]|nr:response regulator [Gammaproteobacteria bacterium]